MKKKGFTLVELLVAMLCTTLILGMVFSTVYYISRVNGDLLDKSNALYRLSLLDDNAKGKSLDAFRQILEDEYADILPADSYIFAEVTGYSNLYTFNYTYNGKKYSFVFGASADSP